MLKGVKFVLEMLSYSGFRNRFLIMILPWFVVGMVSYGLSFAVKLVQFDIFILTIIKQLVGMVAILAVVPLYERVS